MKLYFHKHFCPRNDVVFAVLFGERDLFCKLISAVTGDEIDIIGKPYTQATLRERNVLLETIRFDIFAHATNSKLYTADMQRAYQKSRIARRTMFYACRAVSNQHVIDMAYEDLKPVNISFILTDHNELQPIRRVRTYYEDTKELFDDLLEITLVYVPAVIRECDKYSDLYIFARFFVIESQEDADQFVDELGHIELGKELIRMYNGAVADVQGLLDIEDSSYFKWRLTEAKAEEIRLKTEMKTKKEMVLNMLEVKLPLDTIARIAKLSVEQVREWA